MTRRERHVRIIGSFDAHRRRIYVNELLSRFGLDCLTDEAVESLASKLVGDHKWQQRENAKQRAKHPPAVAAE